MKLMSEEMHADVAHPFDYFGPEGVSKKIHKNSCEKLLNCGICDIIFMYQCPG
jgi:hypothetical protein